MRSFLRAGCAVGATLLAVPLGGCSAESPAGMPGEINNGIFSYVCDSENDPVCNDQGVGDLLEMPAAVAVGARFSLHYTPSPFGDDSGGSARVEPASSAMLIQTEPSSSSFQGVAPGLGAILARRGEMVVDFIHVRIEQSDRVRVDRYLYEEDTAPTAESIEELDLDLGAPTVLRGYAVDAAGTALGGAQAASWASSNEDVVSFVSGTASIDAVVTGAGVGTATLSVTVGEQVAEVEVTVGGGQ